MNPISVIQATAVCPGHDSDVWSGKTIMWNDNNQTAPAALMTRPTDLSNEGVSHGIK